MRTRREKLTYWFNSIPFQRKAVLFFLLLAFIISTIATIFITYFTNEMLKEKISDQLYSTLYKIDENISSSMNLAERVSDTLYEDPRIQDYLQQDFSSLESSQSAARVPNHMLSMLMDANDELSSIHISRNDAASLYAGDIFNYAWESLKLSSIFDLANEGNGDYVWIYDYYYTSHLLSDNNKILCNARVTYNAQGHPDSLFLVNVKESALVDAITVSGSGTDSSYLIMDSRGAPLVHSEDSFLNIYTAELPFVDQILEDNKSFTFTINQENYLVNWTKSSKLDWYIVSFTPASYIAGNTEQVVSLAVAVYSISMLLAAVLSVLFSRGLTNSIIGLSDNFKQIEKGNLDVRATIKGEDEINHLALQFNRMLDKLEETVHELSEEQVAKQMVEINALQEQINPHFLYNTLESINSLAIINGYTDISRLVLALSKMLRIGLNKGLTYLALGDEMEHVKHYLYIQNVRHDQKLNLRFSIPSELMDYPVIKLLLQPLVENSIMHGFENKDERCTLLIRAQRQGDDVLLEVMDNGRGISEETLANIASSLYEKKKPTKNIYGIFNVHQRIQLHYGDGYGLSYRSVEGHYTVVSIRLPYHTKEIPNGGDT